MSTSFTFSDTITFTVTHARHMAAKVATDLKRMQRFYGAPSDTLIDFFEEEVTQLLRHGYLDNVYYGFQKNGSWIKPTLIYTARDLAGGGTDDDPGRVLPGADVTGAEFGSFLTHSAAWRGLSYGQQAAFEAALSLQRSTGLAPTVSGYVTSDRTYSAGGRALDRQSVKSW